MNTFLKRVVHLRGSIIPAAAISPIHNTQSKALPENQKERCIIIPTIRPSLLLLLPSRYPTAEQTTTGGSNGAALLDNRSRPIQMDGSIMSRAGGHSHTLPAIVRCLIDGVRASATDAAPKLREDSRNSARDLIIASPKEDDEGSFLPALLLIAVGTFALFLANPLFGVAAAVYAVFWAAAAVYAVFWAAAGGFLAFFFSLLSAIYIGVSAVAFFAISTVMVSTIVAVLIATSPIWFFVLVCSAIWKAASAVSSYSRQAENNQNDS